MNEKRNEAQTAGDDADQAATGTDGFPALDRGLEDLAFTPLFQGEAPADDAPAHVLFAFEMPASGKTCLVFSGQLAQEGDEIEVMAGFCFPDELEALAEGSIDRLHLTRLATQEEVNAVEVVLAGISNYGK